jgi:hypothetical protein
MSTLYELRDKDGVLKANLSERVAKNMMLSSKGDFRDVKLTSGEVKRLYEFKENYAFGDVESVGVSVMVWSGDSLRLKTPEPEITSTASRKPALR